MRHIPGPIHSRYDNRASPIGFKAAIVKAEGLGYLARRMIGFRVEFAPIGKGARIKLRVTPAGDRKRTRLNSSHTCATRMPTSAYNKKYRPRTIRQHTTS